MRGKHSITELYPQQGVSLYSPQACGLPFQQLVYLAPWLVEVFKDLVLFLFLLIFNVCLILQHVQLFLLHVPHCLLEIASRNNFVLKIRNNVFLKNFPFCQTFRPLPFHDPPKPFSLCKIFWNSAICIWICGKDVGLFLVCPDLKDTAFEILAEIWTIQSFIRFPSYGRSQALFLPTVPSEMRIHFDKFSKLLPDKSKLLPSPMLLGK